MVRLPDIIDAEYCVIEVVKSLHDAKKLAIQNNDTKVMMDVVAGWFELHERFVVAESEEERGTLRFGFHNTREDDESPAISETVHEPFVDDREEEIDDEPNESRHHARL